MEPTVVLPPSQQIKEREKIKEREERWALLGLVGIVEGGGWGISPPKVNVCLTLFAMGT
jgi:hypothetical protein